jgi:hypothetical protein
VTQVRAVEGLRITEHGPRLFERDPVLGTIDCGLPRVPLEHASVYTKLRGLASRIVDYDLVLKNAPLIVDTRGIYRIPVPHVVKA